MSHSDKSPFAHGALFLLTDFAPSCQCITFCLETGSLFQIPRKILFRIIWYSCSRIAQKTSHFITKGDEFLKLSAEFGYFKLQLQ